MSSFNSSRHYSPLDTVINMFDNVLRGFNCATHQPRPNPSTNHKETIFNNDERKQVAGLMRVNHVGEVCAQALYQGQALTARNTAVREKLQQAAEEEVDHLIWCRERLEELNSHTSYLNPVWYTGSLLLGIVAGLISDEINLGFLAETEHQVEQHLASHLEKLPAHDAKSRAIVEQMKIDEAHHAQMAEENGATHLPYVVQQLMRLSAKIMTSTAYWV